MNIREYINKLKENVNDYNCEAGLNLSFENQLDLGWACFFTNGEVFGAELPRCILDEKSLYAWIFIESCFPATLEIEAEITEVGDEKNVDIYHPKLKIPIASYYENKSQLPYNHKCTLLKKEGEHKKGRVVLACNLHEKRLKIQFKRDPNSNHSMDIMLDIN